MTDLPPWYSIAVLGLAAALGAAFAAFWRGLYPFGDPNIFAFAALCAAVAYVGVSDTFRALTRQPMDPSMAVTEIVVGGVFAGLLTQHFIPFLIAAAVLVYLRGQAGALTRRIVDLYDAGSAEAARRTRRSFMNFMLVFALVLIPLCLFSALDKSASLFAWRTAPIVIVAGVCGLILVSGAEYEVMRSRFRGGEVTADSGFGQGWWGPVAGVIAAVVIISAVVPALPSVITLKQVGSAVVSVSERAVPTSGNPQNEAAPTDQPSGVSKVIPRVVRKNAGIYIFLALLLTLLVTIAIRLVRYAHRLGIDAASAALEYWRRAVATGTSSAAFFTGFYDLLVQGLRDGDWRGMLRFLRRWWMWLLDVISGRAFRNIWRQLGIRSATHRAGAEFAIAAGPRTAAGAIWNLPPGDPRRRVRELYRQFMQDAKDAGLARRPSQTPATYRQAIAETEPGTAEGLGQLTGAYEWARFSQHDVTADHLTQASGGWQRIAGFFVKRKAAAQTQAARGHEDRRGRQVEKADPDAVGQRVTVRAAAKRRR